ncbi:porphobilinogen deaminase, dipyromethane cofactor binding domain-containing protein [Dipodascopsis tothii]|uniref:porphobilinogen deaminase, dipyromethane cofactor binding domain-containing protein n=1 Tax=Dipodascopsis tothii TaxID=44089 RepID=UPI0034CE2E98
MSDSKQVLKLGTRTSQLAVEQTQIIINLLKAKFPELETKIVARTTLADNVQSRALYAFGGKPVWTAELEELLLADAEDPELERIDMVVHSLKDLPTAMAEPFRLAAMVNRADPRDVLLVRPGLPYKSLAELPAGSVVGTSSVRRTAQLLRRYPQLEFKVVRGNINTRIAKLSDESLGYTAIVLAAAGLLRIGLEEHITQYLGPEDMMYAVGQGALGVEIRADDARAQALLDAIAEPAVQLECTAERALMRELEGGCSVPLGVHTTWTTPTTLTVAAAVVATDGDAAAEASESATVTSVADAEALGVRLAAALRANGAGPILAKISYDKLAAA